MRADSFWVYQDEFWGGGPILNVELLGELRTRPPELHDDVESALALIRICYEEFLAYGTNGTTQMTDADSREALRTLRTLLKKVGYSKLSLPFSDFSSFRSHWHLNGAKGNWQARRDILRQIFEPSLVFLEDLQDTLLSNVNGNTLMPIAHDFNETWTEVGKELLVLKRNFATAQTPQEFRNVGNDCVAVLIRLGRLVYTEEVHEFYGDDLPREDDVKLRLDRYVERKLSGRSNASLRSLSKKIVEVSHATKHDLDGSRLRTAMATDAVIMLANLIRSIDAHN
jgi:hypothetical protein